MIPSDLGPLRVRADLRLVVGETRASVTGDGDRLTLTTDDVVALLGQAAEVAPGGAGVSAIRRNVRMAGRALDNAGLTVRITDRRGTLMDLGAGCRSGAGRLMLGSPHASFGSPRAVLPVLAGYAKLSSIVRSRASYMAGGLALAGFFVGVGSHRRASRVVAPGAHP